MRAFGGPVLALPRDDINTDEIIPAKYLTEVDKEALGPHLLEDLKLTGFARTSGAFAQARAVVTGENFGCGSSREHAPWALEVNGITAVFARSFARIFRQNMFNGGLLAVTLEPEAIEAVLRLCDREPVSVSVDLDGKTALFSAEAGETLEAPFTLSEFDEALVRAGGWVEYADSHY